MLHVHIYLDPDEAERLQKIKGDMTWKELLMSTYEDASELYTTLKLVYVLATSGVGSDDERWNTVIKRAEDILFPDEEADDGGE